MQIAFMLLLSTKKRRGIFKHKDKIMQYKSRVCQRSKSIPSMLTICKVTIFRGLSLKTKISPASIQKRIKTIWSKFNTNRLIVRKERRNTNAKTHHNLTYFLKRIELLLNFYKITSKNYSSKKPKHSVFIIKSVL